MANKWVVYVLTQISYDFFCAMITFYSLAKAPMSEDLGFKEEFLGKHNLT